MKEDILGANVNGTKIEKNIESFVLTLKNL